MSTVTFRVGGNDIEELKRAAKDRLERFFKVGFHRDYGVGEIRTANIRDVKMTVDEAKDFDSDYWATVVVEFPDLIVDQGEIELR